MKKISKIILAIVGSACLTAYAATNPCQEDIDNGLNNMHCAYFTGLNEGQGRYVKIKRVNEFKSPFTIIACMANNEYLNIDSYEAEYLQYEEGRVIKWETSQCADENCAASKLITPGKFVIHKTTDQDGNEVYTSDPQTTAVKLDPNYGANCSLIFTKAQGKHAIGLQFNKVRAAK